MSSVSAILNNTRSALTAQTDLIRVTSDNISNVNTPGYVKRRANVNSRVLEGTGDGLQFGQGVSIGNVQRIVDEFLNSRVLAQQATASGAEMRSEVLSRLEAPFALDALVGNIGEKLTSFFNSLEDLSPNPADIALRQNVLEKGGELVTSIQNTFNIIASLQDEANSRIGTMISEVNRITADIADLNQRILSAETDDQEHLGLRDQRDSLLQDLAEYVEFSTVETSDGAVQVYLSNGFGLVGDTFARPLEFVVDPSFSPVGGYPPSLSGGGMGHIVFDFDETAGTSHLNLTDAIAGGGGKIGALLNVRGVQSDTDTSPFDAVGDLPAVAARVEAITLDLLTRFNTEYLGPDEDATTLGHQASSADLNGNAPAVFGLFDLGGLESDSGGITGIPDLSDITALGLANVSSLIEFAVDDPEDLAAARDIDTADGSTAFTTGDNSNIVGLLSQRNATTDYSTFSLNNLSSTSTIGELYDNTVTYVGGLAGSAKTSSQLEQDRLSQLEALQDSKSKVNLDEE
ncbi:MAG: flagellar hook-associated protein FlgK, partial [Bdellovibrionales bacterium]|nr:flagellar hook-associated protein FlgK [Bdellovibrionales bacterium]